MPSNADSIVGQIQQDMQALMAYVTGPETATETAYAGQTATVIAQLTAEAARDYRAIDETFVVVNHMLHSAARRPKGLGWRYEAHLRGLDMCSINLTSTN